MSQISWNFWDTFNWAGSIPLIWRENRFANDMLNRWNALYGTELSSGIHYERGKQPIFAEAIHSLTLSVFSKR